jgi:signal transduction histidine kinase
MKLLNRTISSYLIFSAIILLVAVPVFYIVIQRIVSKDVDEGLLLQKEELVKRLYRVVPLNAFDWLDAFEPDIRLTPTQIFQQYDTMYTATLLERRSQKKIRYRILESNVLINGIPYNIQLKNSLLNNDELIRTIVLVQSLLLLLITAGLILINRSLSKRIWKPFYSTLRKLKNHKIESGDGLEFEKTDIDEFANLNQTISALTNRNRQVYLSQKEFTENAAHEMQTPLAVFQSKMELLMQTAPMSKEQADLISGLSDAGKRMNRLNKSLLLLAKMDNHQFQEKESVDITEMVTRTVEHYHNSMIQKDIHLEKNFAGEVIFASNRSLLEIMLANLLSNAIKHNFTSGKIFVSLDKKNLVFQNTGNSAALDQGKLFRRFQRQTTEVNSIGLGLEIVKKICDLSGFRIEYAFIHNLHTFSIAF